ncbi:MAG TPA: 16S rRNA (cytosine(967)-C(5))-methyltransferase RsmB [Burkholderiales bacterium]|nr:16S rRNA (cytosine(967)-C(5))-methyltransferase RsmB [Burkholderiales bacterium]
MKASLAEALKHAAPIVTRVVGGRSLADELVRLPESEERAAVVDLAHGTLRRFGRVQFLSRALSHREPADETVQALLWCALYALDSGRYSEYTVVDQAVRACTLLEKWNAKGYLNAVLRAYLRQRASLEIRIQMDAEARFQHPAWWIDALRTAYPDSWEAALLAGNTHPPMTLRVNRRRSSVAEYLARLAGEGLSARQVGPDALLLERPVPVSRLPGFADGHASVQDAGAQLAAGFLDLAPGQRVLDACAAPGGKTGHILERAEVSLVALDADASRLERVQANLARLGSSATLLAADCTDLAAWWDGNPFDRILADVPCTASGIVRRHPDLKWLRRPSDAGNFATRQGGILDALWHALAPGGKLLYVTCSVFPEENGEVVDGFLNRTKGAHLLALADGAASQRLPDGERDGFYYALIARQA